MKIMSIILCTLIYTSTGYSMPGSKQMDKGDASQRLKDKLGLNEDQVKKMKEIQESKQSSNFKQEQEALHNLRKNFKEAMKNPATSNSDLLNKFNEIQNKQNSLKRGRFEHMLKMREVLTPEQRVKFHQMREERGGKRRGNMDEHRKGMMGTSGHMMNDESDD